MEGDIDNDIYRNNPCHKQVIEEREIDDYEQKGQCNNTNQRLVLSLSCTYQLMVDMVLICPENRLVMQ
jgi:hypothetical protein